MNEGSVTVRGKKWERKNSRWILWSIFSLAGIGFIKIGHKAEEKKWVAIGIFYLAFLWGGVFLFDILDGTAAESYSVIYSGGYIVSIVHSFMVKKTYLIKYDQVLHKQEVGLEEEKIKRDIEEQERIQKQKIAEIEKMKALQEYEQAKADNAQMEKEDDEENNNISNIIKWVALPIALLVFDVWLYFTFMDFNDFHAWAPVLEIIMAVVFLIWAVFGIVSWNNTCPECNAWDALVEIDKQIINVRNITINKTVEEKVYKANGMYTHKIEPSQVIQRKVSVPGKEYTYDITLKCKKCGYITHKTTTEKVED